MVKDLSLVSGNLGKKFPLTTSIEIFLYSEKVKNLTSRPIIHWSFMKFGWSQKLIIRRLSLPSSLPLIYIWSTIARLLLYHIYYENLILFQEQLLDKYTGHPQKGVLNLCHSNQDIKIYVQSLTSTAAISDLINFMVKSVKCYLR